MAQLLLLCLRMRREDRVMERLRSRWMNKQ